MFLTKAFPIKRGNFEKSAQEAIQSFFNEEGYAPKEVIVHPETNIGKMTQVEVKLAGKKVSIPIRRQAVLPGVDITHAALGIEEPNSAAE